MPDVALTNLTKSYLGVGKTPAVHDFNLTISNGELLTVVGPSGSGKTTLLRLISGLETPETGEITIGGRIVNSIPPGDRNVAMVFQSFALYPHLTVRDNLGFPLKIRKSPKAQIANAVAEFAQMLGLTELLDRRPDTLSSGERQRVALGRALVQRPDVFLLDEPLSNVDAALRLDLRRLIADLHRRLKTTIIYVTHDQVEAMTLGDRVAVIRRGQLEQVGTAAQIYDTPATAFVARFIGSPGMNLLPGKLLREGEQIMFKLESAGPSLPFPLDPRIASNAASQVGRKVLLGIRPEHIHPADHPAAILTGVVELTERTGAETVLHLRSESVQLKLRVPGNATARIGDKLAVRFELNHIRLFDADSGRRII